MGRKLPFLPTCGGPSKILSFHARTATTTTTTATATEFDDMETSVESAIQGLSSERFFFNPGKTSSILEDAKPNKKDKEKESVVTFKESVSMMEMQSTDPFVDFKNSMQEMVEADEGLKKWENLQELLCLYLAVNDKINHGYIIGAFVDLLVNLGSPLSCSTSSVIGQEKNLLMESGSNTCSDNKNKRMMICGESTVAALSFTSSSASSSGTCSSTCSCSHCLSSSSLEDDDNHEDDEDHQSPQKSLDYDSSSKV